MTSPFILGRFQYGKQWGTPNFAPGTPGAGVAMREYKTAPTDPALDFHGNFSQVPNVFLTITQLELDIVASEPHRVRYTIEPFEIGMDRFRISIKAWDATSIINIAGVWIAGNKNMIGGLTESLLP
jgi:hypothetical protein